MRLGDLEYRRLEGALGCGGYDPLRNFERIARTLAGHAAADALERFDAPIQRGRVDRCGDFPGDFSRFAGGKIDFARVERR